MQSRIMLHLGKSSIRHDDPAGDCSDPSGVKTTCMKRRLRMPVPSAKDAMMPGRVRFAPEIMAGFSRDLILHPKLQYTLAEVRALR